MDRIQCPYCGEDIIATAKKCRYCGEWLQEDAAVIKSKPYKAPTPLEVVEVSTASDSGNLPMVESTSPTNAVPTKPFVAPNSQPQQAINAPGGQPIIVNVVNQNSVEQRVEHTQTVIMADGGRSKEAPGWIFGELWFIAAGIGFATKSWWWFLGLALGGSILLMIPFIGALMCVVLGLGWGLLAGAVGAALFGKAAGWVIGIIVALGAVYGHLEARKANMDEMDEE